MEWGMLIYGVLSGAVYAGAGWLKSQSPDGKVMKFEAKYAVMPVLIGAAAGAWAAYKGISFEQVHLKFQGAETILGPGGVGFVQNLLQLGARRIGFGGLFANLK